MGRALALCSPDAAAACAGLNRDFASVSFSFWSRRWFFVGGSGSQKSGTFLEIGSDGYLDHTRYFSSLLASQVDVKSLVQDF